jgi:hypothetical protein
MDFSSSLCVQTGSEVNPASYPVGTEGPFQGVKRGRGLTLTTYPHPVPNDLEGILRSLLAPAWRSGTALLYL